jgi:thymidylate synthase
MYLPVPSKQTCAAAWLEATEAVNAAQDHEAHNVIIDVAEPLSQSATDGAIFSLVDGLLRTQEKLPVQSVANTIFPEALYRRHGAPAFMDKFHKKLLPKLRKNDRWSGYYFERMTAYPKPNGESLNQLWGIVERIRNQNNRSLNKFEMSLFDPDRDIDNSPYGGQCLSFLSFKLIPGAQKKLTLTALYRNHYYIEKLLGNLIGLSRLMAFVAAEGGVSVGPLTVISTHAVVDAPKGARRTEIDKLLSDCRAAQEVREAA